MKKFVCGIVAIGLIFAGSFPSYAQSWPEFRGSGQQGHSNAENVPLNWSDASPNLAWKTAIPGLGWSSPSYDKNEIWITSALADEGRLLAFCINSTDGSILHEIEVFKLEDLGKIHGKNSHASPTPVIDGDLVFVHFGAHGTACLNRKGEIVWKKQFPYGHFHGPGGSPIVYKNRLILNCDGDKEQFVIALDKATGEEIWRTKRDHILPERFTGGKMVPIGFSTPLVAEINGQIQLISNGPDHVAGYDIDSGKELWWFSYDGYSNVPRPILSDDLLFICSGYDRPVLYAIKIGGSGDITESGLVWKMDKQAPLNPSPLVIGDELYLVNDRGIAMCLDKRTGETHWQERFGADYSASLLHVADRIYFTDEVGKTTVVKPGKTFEKLAENSVEGRTLASLTPINGAIFVRTDTHLLRFNNE